MNSRSNSSKTSTIKYTKRKLPAVIPVGSFLFLFPTRALAHYRPVLPHVKSIIMKNTPVTLVAVVICLLLTSTILTPARASAIPFGIFSDTGALLQKNSTPPNKYLRLNEINARAARDFTLRYPTITDEKWLRSSHGYSVKFVQGEITNHVHYDRGGYFINALRYYGHNSIPEPLKRRIQRAFSGYSILSLTEVVNEKGSSFHLNIKNITRIKSILVTAQHIEVIDDFRNASPEL